MIKAHFIKYCLNQRGVALLLAVSVISLLMAVTVQFNRDMRHELTGSANMLASAKLGVMVRSGYNLAVAVVEEDGNANEFDSYHDSWAGLQGEDMPQLYGSGSLDLVITDESGRLQLNSLANTKKEQGQNNSVGDKTRQILLRLLTSGALGEMDSDEATLIVNSISDWIDGDEEPRGIEETESSFYRSLDPAYSCKNGPLEFIEELLLVRGITSKLFYGNEELSGLRDLLTVHGDDGKININTAPAVILKALSDPVMDDETAEKLILFRQDNENKDLLKETTWYENIPMGTVSLDPGTLTTASSYFTIVAAAEYNGMEKTLEAVVARKDGNIPVMINRKVQ